MMFYQYQCITFYIIIFVKITELKHRETFNKKSLKIKELF